MDGLTHCPAGVPAIVYRVPALGRRVCVTAGTRCSRRTVVYYCRATARVTRCRRTEHRCRRALHRVVAALTANVRSTACRGRRWCRCVGCCSCSCCCCRCCSRWCRCRCRRRASSDLDGDCAPVLVGAREEGVLRCGVPGVAACRAGDGVLVNEVRHGGGRWRHGPAEVLIRVQEGDLVVTTARRVRQVGVVRAGVHVAWGAVVRAL